MDQTDKIPSGTRLSRFQQDGYVCEQPLYSVDEIDELNREIARFIRDIVPTMPAEKVYYEDKADKTSLKQIQRMFDYDAYFRHLMDYGPARRIAEEVLQDEVVPVNMQHFNKPAGIGRPTPPHPDGDYFHLTPCDAVTGWLALEDVDEENGCIHYVRGSHLEENFRSHGSTGVLGFSQGIEDFGTANDRANEVSLPGPAGTFLMHHAKTIHWAGANQSATRSRRALGFIYYAKRAKPDLDAARAYQKRLDAQLKSTGKI
jgi:ectoine hydroxylase-related dioxygenase (phytanoyl-CoA dioxygenase family)